MASFQDGQDTTFKAGNTSCPAYRIVAPSSVGNYYAQIHITGTSIYLGISQSDASTTGEAWKIRTRGTSKVTCGASVSAGALLIAQTDTGKAIEGTLSANTTTTAIPRSIGVALEAGSTNSVIEMLIAINNVTRYASG